MRWEDLRERLLDFAHEFRKQKVGIIGVGLLLVLVLLGLLAPFVADPNAYRNWNNIEYWEEYPKSVPPEWMSIFSGKSIARHSVIPAEMTANKTTGGQAIFQRWVVNYTYKYQVPPKGILLRILFKNLGEQTPYMSITVIRPDDTTIQLASKPIQNTETKIYIEADTEAKRKIISFARNYDPAAAEIPLDTVTPQVLMTILFSKAQEGMSNPKTAEPLHGTYSFVFEFYLYNPGEDKIDAIKGIFQGAVFGLLGTDDNGRDLWSGIVWGIWVALMIGVFTSLIGVFIGLIYGVTSAYLGGKWDEVLQRIDDIVYSMPVLPILIIMAAVWRPSIWNIVFLLAAFSWPGFAKVVRSMALQIKEEPFVEAARAAGASGFKIVTRHIAPQILPYTFANIALGVPGAILSEAGLSFLGLGDPTIPTWGQILHDAQAAFATIRGLWWWVLIPGFMIALVGLTFALLGMAMDAILNPKLRKI
ncbi:MAG: ABC transporter permease [Candidatus Njordarchaeia archaeon]